MATEVHPEQLRLEGTEVRSEPFRIRPAVCLLGLTEVQRCREILAARDE